MKEQFMLLDPVSWYVKATELSCHRGCSNALDPFGT